MSRDEPKDVSAHRVAHAPSDVLRMVVAAALLVAVVLLGWLLGDTLVSFTSKLLSGLEALPQWLVTLLVVVSQVLTLVLLLGGFIAAMVRRHWFLVGSCVLAAVVSNVLLLVLRPLVSEAAVGRAHIDHRYTLLAPDEVPTTASLAALTAMVTAAAPWVSRRWRRAAWLLVVIVAVLQFLGAHIGFDTLLAFLAGWLSGSAVVVLLGAPSRRPTSDAIAAGMASVGFPLAELEPASVDARGSTPYFATGVDGSPLFVKALGDDERSADLLFRVYRRIQPHDLGDEKAFSTLRRAVEHEALVALAARDLGVRTPRLVAFASADPNGFVLAYEAIAGRSLDRLDPDELTDGVLGGVWAQLSLLRKHRVAHRDLRLANVFLADDGQAWIIDFGFSELAASDLLLATDVAEFVASTATKVGAERAVAAGRSAVGPEGLRTSLDRLALPMLSGATRSALKAAPEVLVDVRQRISA